MKVIILMDIIEHTYFCIIKLEVLNYKVKTIVFVLFFFVVVVLFCFFVVFLFLDDS